MAQPGPKPKPEDQRRNQNRPMIEWQQIIDMPYEGPVPELGGRVPIRTMRWWRIVSKQPHCVIWDDNDWEFAVATAWIHAAWVKKATASLAIELRHREQLLGMTWWARRDLRLRYIKATDEEQVEPPVSLAERRRELEG